MPCKLNLPPLQTDKVMSIMSQLWFLNVEMVKKNSKIYISKFTLTPVIAIQVDAL